MENNYQKTMFDNMNKLANYQYDFMTSYFKTIIGGDKLNANELVDKMLTNPFELFSLFQKNSEKIFSNSSKFIENNQKYHTAFLNYHTALKDMMDAVTSNINIFNENEKG